MRVRYHWIQGKEVRTADGRRLGHVTDLVAEAEGDTLRVTKLLVGPVGLVRRIGFTHHRVLTSVQPVEIPWRLVADLGHEICLSVDHAELQALLAREKDGATNACEGVA